jgi:ankyrin repeat protein
MFKSKCFELLKELVAELLAQGADISVLSSDGNSSLHYASLNERKGIIEILLRSGANPNTVVHISQYCISFIVLL